LKVAHKVASQKMY